MYIVIKAFYDLTDPVKVKVVKGGVLPLKYRLYLAGDVFPAPYAPTPSAERIAELASDKNKQGTPVIKWVDDPISEDDKAEEVKAEEAASSVSPAEEPEAKVKETPAKAEKAPAKRKTTRKAAGKSASTKTTTRKRTTRKKAAET